MVGKSEDFFYKINDDKKIIEIKMIHKNQLVEPTVQIHYL